jgi:hypothetical protein
LEPCTTYVITANAYLGKRLSGEVIFEGSQVQIETKTMPDMTKPFELKTLRANINPRSLTVVWEKSELDQCLSIEGTSSSHVFTNSEATNLRIFLTFFFHNFLK